MIIRPAGSTDAGAIAALVRSFEAVLVVEPGAAQPFWESMSERAHAANLACSNFRYFVAEAEGELIGFIAIRDEVHLFNLFVARAFQGQGIGRALWHHAIQTLPDPSAQRPFTVNATLQAVPVYKAFGFRVVGAMVRCHGIAFVPMVWEPVR